MMSLVGVVGQATRQSCQSVILQFHCEVYENPFLSIHVLSSDFEFGPSPLYRLPEVATSKYSSF